jgi:hypothetical protein
MPFQVCWPWTSLHSCNEVVGPKLVVQKQHCQLLPLGIISFILECTTMNNGSTIKEYSLLKVWFWMKHFSHVIYGCRLSYWLSVYFRALNELFFCIFFKSLKANILLISFTYIEFFLFIWLPNVLNDAQENDSDYNCWFRKCWFLF